MPDWIRRYLAITLTQEQTQSIRVAFQNLLITAVQGTVSGVQLEIAQQHQSFFQNLTSPMLKLLSRQVLEEDPLRDIIFLDFMAGKPLLAVEVPKELTLFFRNSQQEILRKRKQLVPVATAVSLIALIIISSVWQPLWKLVSKRFIFEPIVVEDAARYTSRIILVGLIRFHEMQAYQETSSNYRFDLTKLDDPIFDSSKFTWRDGLKIQMIREYGDVFIPPSQSVEDQIEEMARYFPAIEQELEAPITSTFSWYRSPVYNRMVGGTSRSVHLAGHAVDIEVEGLSSAEIYEQLDEFWAAGGLAPVPESNVISIDARGVRARWGPFPLLDFFPMP